MSADLGRAPGASITFVALGLMFITWHGATILPNEGRDALQLGVFITVIGVAFIVFAACVS